MDIRPKLPAETGSGGGLWSQALSRPWPVFRLRSLRAERAYNARLLLLFGRISRSASSTRNK